MILYIFTNIIFIYQMFIKTIIEFLQIYQKNMLSIIDHLMNENLENDLKKKKKKKNLN